MSEIRKRRVGTTLACQISVITNGQELPLEGRDITVLLVNPLGVCKRTNATFSGNVATFVYEGNEQQYTGVYRVEVYENFENESQTVFDKDAFELVARSYMEEDGVDDLSSPLISLSGSIELAGKDGKSAYELAVEQGFVGDVDAWLESLKPVKGVDYFTASDKQSIVEETAQAVETNIAPVLDEKQDVIGDLSDIREGAEAGSTAYQKPSSGIPKSDLSSGVRSSLDKADTALQEHQDISGKQDVINDLDKIRSGAELGATALQSFTETDPTVPSWAKQSSKPTYTAQEVGALPVTTPIPTKTSDLTNDVPFLTQHQDISGKQNVIQDLSTIRSGAQAGSTALQPSAIADWAKSPTKPSYTPNEVGAGKVGVVSQTMTRTGDNNTGYDYTMSNLVYGQIPQANIDLYEAAGAVFNEQSGYFELNGLANVSYGEMSVIYAQSIGAVPHSASRSLQFIGYSQRTTIPLRATTSFATNLQYWAYNSSIVMLSTMAQYTSHTNFAGAFRGCANLKRVFNPSTNESVRLSGSGTLTNTFEGCYSLEYITINKLNGNINFSNSSRLELSAIVYIVSNAANTSTITITLHATAFARCQTDTTEYTYNGNTYTGIIAYASAKDITIQSA